MPPREQGYEGAQRGYQGFESEEGEEGHLSQRSRPFAAPRHSMARLPKLCR